MALSPTAALLKQILSDDEEHMYMAVTQRAMEWMTAGFVTEANTLLEILWSHNLPHTQYVWLSDESLQMMWELSNQYPQRFPFELQSTKEIEIENWQRNIKKNQLHLQELGQYKFNIGNETYDTSDQPKAIIKAIENYLKEKPQVSNHAHATACGALIAARSNNTSKAEQFIKLWGQTYLVEPADHGLWNLMRDSLTAKILLSGILAPVFKLTKATCQQEIIEISEKLAERMQHGRGLMYGELSWEQLLHKISASAISQNTGDFSDEAKAINYLGKPPASASEIEDAEKRLQLTLPEDYKQFLLTSNGFDSIVSPGGITISSIDRVDYFINADRILVEIWMGNPEKYSTLFSEKLGNSIIIGGHTEEQQLLLIPLGNQQWECWHLSPFTPGETIYPNFRFYMEEELQRLESGYYDL